MIKCPHCDAKISIHRNPVPTVDIIIDIGKGKLEESQIVLIKRKNPPFGWALPGGFIDYGESAEDAARREAFEETGLEITLTDLVGVYSDPLRDPRQHTISTAFSAIAQGKPAAGDDAADVRIFSRDSLPDELAFDHSKILADYFINFYK